MILRVLASPSFIFTEYDQNLRVLRGCYEGLKSSKKVGQISEIPSLYARVARRARSQISETRSSDRWARKARGSESGVARRISQPWRFHTFFPTCSYDFPTSSYVFLLSPAIILLSPTFSNLL